MSEMRWSDTERADSAVCAALLHTGWIWWAASCVAQLYLLIFFSTGGHWADLFLTLLIWFGVTWMAVRVRLDAVLFDQLARANGPLADAATLDGALAHVLNVRRHAESWPRSMAARTAGARRLYLWLVALCIAHGSCLLYECVRQTFGRG